MEGKASDWRPGPTVCRCCLTEGCYKDISTEYFWMGKREVYAEMLSDTLNISISFSKSGGPNSNSRLICEPCISRLRDASEFKRQVIDCEKTFIHHLDPGSSSKVQEFTVDLIGEVKVEKVKREKESNSDDDFDDRPDFLDIDTDDDLDDQPLTKLASKIPKKETVDILDLLDNSQITVKRKSNVKLKAPPKKIVKKKEAVAKPSASKPTPPKQTEKKKGHEKEKRNAEVLLQYSTLYPFRTKGQNLMCVYCSDGVEDFDEFRCHVDQKHEKVDIRKAFASTKSRNRPSDGTRLKVDCFNLKCKICSQSYDTIEEIAEHLFQHDNKETKDIDLNYKLGLHPYRLIKDNLHCLVCNMKLPTLTKLTRHVTSHFAAYTCGSCDKTYLNEQGLKMHVKFAHSKKHICRKCFSEFSTFEEKKEHLKASSQCWSTICNHCGEKFASWDQKQKHLVRKHDVKPLTYPCPDCDVVFKTRYHFYYHYNTTHSEQALMCSYCSKKFRSKSLLDNHLITHTGKREFQCNVCPKAFYRMRNLQDHMWTHSETKRYPCELCSNMAFAKKCSLVSHIKNAHPEVSQ